jgi:hypothetical protein
MNLSDYTPRMLDCIGSARIEWADGESVWILQLQQEEAISSGRVFVPSETESEVKSNSKLMLELQD